MSSPRTIIFKKTGMYSLDVNGKAVPIKTRSTRNGYVVCVNPQVIKKNNSSQIDIIDESAGVEVVILKKGAHLKDYLRSRLLA